MSIIGNFKMVLQEMIRKIFLCISAVIALMENIEGLINFTAQWELDSDFIS